MVESEEIFDLEKMISFAEKKHSGQTRKNGDPYIFHPVRVSNYLVKTDCSGIAVVAGLFHDLLEDTDATEEEIRDLAGEDVLRVVKLLTKRKDMPSKTYIANILSDPDAKLVKNADRIDNLAEVLNSADIEFAQRYLSNTKEYYYGKFSDELDKACDRLEASLNENYKYVLDDTFFQMDSPVYRVSEDDEKAWVFNCLKKEWVETDRYFWTDLGDNALPVTKEDAYKLIKPYLK